MRVKTDEINQAQNSELSDLDQLFVKSYNSVLGCWVPSGLAGKNFLHFVSFNPMRIIPLMVETMAILAIT